MSDDVRATCLCLAVRRLGRRISQAYESRLAPTGLTITQFTLLAAVDTVGPGGAPLAPIADALDMDPSTLSRTIRPLVRDRLVTLAPGEDRRARLARLTAAGRARLKDAMPHWRAAQRETARMLGADAHRQLSTLLAGAHRL
ncbi:MAG: MarR family winged helix-turn-helix transcriptional regulator [Alphaproteobacteria bacterium]